MVNTGSRRESPFSRIAKEERTRSGNRELLKDAEDIDEADSASGGSSTTFCPGMSGVARRFVYGVLISAACSAVPACSPLTFSRNERLIPAIAQPFLCHSSVTISYDCSRLKSNDLLI